MDTTRESFREIVPQLELLIIHEFIFRERL